MNCPSCGAGVSASQVFCPTCGNRLRTVPGAPEVDASPTSESPSSPEDNTDTVYTTRASGSTEEDTTPVTQQSSADEEYPPTTPKDEPATPDYQPGPAFDFGGKESAQPPPSPPRYTTEDHEQQSTPPYQPLAPHYSQQYTPAPQYSSQPRKDADTAFIAELIPGLFGFLGIGHMYGGNAPLGVGLLLGWWVFVFVEFLLFSVLIGFCLLPLLLTLNVAVPLLSAFWVKRSLEGRPLTLGR